VRNFHQGFEHGLVEGLIHTAFQEISFGRGLRERYSAVAGHTRMAKLETLSPVGDDRSHIIGAAKGDGKLTFDKLTDVYHSGTKHEKTSHRTW